jgi:hypothetical protein
VRRNQLNSPSPASAIGQPPATSSPTVMNQTYKVPIDEKTHIVNNFSHNEQNQSRSSEAIPSTTATSTNQTYLIENECKEIFTSSSTSPASSCQRSSTNDEINSNKTITIVSHASSQPMSNTNIAEPCASTSVSPTSPSCSTSSSLPHQTLVASSNVPDLNKTAEFERKLPIESVKQSFIDKQESKHDIKHEANESQDNFEAETVDDVQSLKKTLLKLQRLLINAIPSQEQTTNALEENSAENFTYCCSISSSNNTSCGEVSALCDDFSLPSLEPNEQIAILRSKVQQLEIVADELREELKQAKCENMNTNGTQSGLKHRVHEQDNAILELKNELLGSHLLTESIRKEKEQLERECENYKREIIVRDQMITQLRDELNESHKENEQLKQQLRQFSHTLDIVQQKEVRMNFFFLIFYFYSLNLNIELLKSI